MNKGVELRFTVHKILYDIYKLNKNLDSLYIKHKISDKPERDRSFIKNVSLNSMRYQFHSLKIIKKYIKKKSKINEMLLLISSITQIVFLDFKDYAVINSAVEMSKKFNIYPGFINASLRRISEDKIKLKKTNIDFSSLPVWFIKYTKNLNKNEKNVFLKNYITEPDLHIVFKNENLLLKFKEELSLTSKTSGFLKNKKKIEKIDSYWDGNWWVQDFSSFFPINKTSYNFAKKKCLDLCAAPGGKSFQILAKNNKITLNDKSDKRIKILKTNLERLKFKTKIYNSDALNIKLNEKYDFIIVDAPCTSIGTIRRNPEIFFRSNKPNFEKLTIIQEKILNKAATLLNHKGIILYMVCSFFEIETVAQIRNFLKKNSNFQLDSSCFNVNNNERKMFIKDDYMITLPSKVEKFNIDGFFSAYLKRTD